MHGETMKFKFHAFI